MNAAEEARKGSDKAQHAPGELYAPATRGYETGDLHDGPAGEPLHDCAHAHAIGLCANGHGHAIPNHSQNQGKGRNSDIRRVSIHRVRTHTAHTRGLDSPGHSYKPSRPAAPWYSRCSRPESRQTAAVGYPEHPLRSYS